MAAPSYTTDLVDIALVNVVGGTTNWTAVGGGASGLAAETDFYIQGDGCISKAGWSASVRGMVFSAGAQTIAAGDAVFMWVYFWAPTALSNEAAGGLRIAIGNSTTAYKNFYVRGSDTYQFGGWVCIPVDPTLTADLTTGAPSGVWSFFGATANITGAVTKGNPLGIDAFRRGRAIQMVNGDLPNGYATFAGAATQDNNSGTNRWGLFQAVDGGYLQQGLFVMGLAGTAVDFRDSNRVINIANTKKVGSSFNAFEVRNAASRVDWTNVTITALGTTSRGDFITTNNAAVTKVGCVFTDMGTFGYLGAANISTTTYRRCNLVTQSSANFVSCTFEATNDATRAMLSNNPGAISGCIFTSGGTKHAIEITTAGTYSFSGNQFSGYGADGTTNAAVYNNSGGLVTLNIAGGGATPTVRNGAGASTTISNTKSVTLTGLRNNTEIRVYTSGTTAELAGIEDATAGTSDARTFTFALTAGTIVDIRIHNKTYEALAILAFTIPSTDSSIPVSQRFDRNYVNP